MKALSIKQPWASLICTPREDNPLLGIKDIENRTWRTKFRGRVYVHASGKSAGEIQKLLNSEQFKSISDIDLMLDITIKNIPFSAIIGEVDIIDCGTTRKQSRILGTQSKRHKSFDAGKP